MWYWITCNDCGELVEIKNSDSGPDRCSICGSSDITECDDRWT